LSGNRQDAYGGDSQFDLIQVNYVRYRTLIVHFRSGVPACIRVEFESSEKNGRIARPLEELCARAACFGGWGTSGQQRAHQRSFDIATEPLFHTLRLRAQGVQLYVRLQTLLNGQ
jgi:hypothetical protein